MFMSQIGQPYWTRHHKFSEFSKPDSRFTIQPNQKPASKKFQAKMNRQFCEFFHPPYIGLEFQFLVNYWAFILLRF